MTDPVQPLRLDPSLVSEIGGFDVFLSGCAVVPKDQNVIINPFPAGNPQRISVSVHLDEELDQPNLMFNWLVDPYELVVRRPWGDGAMQANTFVQIGSDNEFSFALNMSLRLIGIRENYASLYNFNVLRRVR